MDEETGDKVSALAALNPSSPLSDFAARAL